MKETIQKIDRLLADVGVKGNSVLLLSDARMLLGDLYRTVVAAEETEEAEAEASEADG